MIPVTAIPVERAPRWRRVIGRLIDIAVLGAFYAAAVAASNENLASIAALVAGTGHSVLGHWQYGRTLGKAAVGTFVIDANGDFPGFGRSVARWAVETGIPIGTSLLTVVFFVAVFHRVDDPWLALFLILLMVVAVMAAWVIGAVVDFIVMMANYEHRSIHDLVAKTWVVVRSKEQRAPATAPAPTRTA